MATNKPAAVRVAQINLHCAKNASANIGRLIIKDRIRIALIQEPWAPHGTVLGLNNDQSKVIWDTRSERPRTCIVIDKNLKHICLSEFLTRDMVPIETSLNFNGTDRKLVIASAYFPGDGSIPPPEVVKLVHHCQRNKLLLLIGCDANAHSQTWGSTDDNERGESLLDFITRENLNVFNIGNTPTFVTQVRQEVLDITMW